MTYYNKSTYTNTSQPSDIPYEPSASSGALDFSTAKPQGVYELIPQGTLARVKITLKPGNYRDDQNPLWNGWATLNPKGSIGLKCDFTVVEGEYRGKKIFGMIGLYSPKSPIWAQIGRSFIRNILDSSHGIRSDDDSPRAQASRQIKSYEVLHNLEFVARIDVEKNEGKETFHNVIKVALTPEHKDYGAHSGYAAGSSSASEPSTASPSYGSPYRNQ